MEEVIEEVEEAFGIVLEVVFRADDSFVAPPTNANSEDLSASDDRGH